MGDIHPLGNATKLNPGPIAGAPRTEMDMAKKPDSTAAAKPKQVVIRLGEAETDTLRPIGGSKSDRFNTFFRPGHDIVQAQFRMPAQPGPALLQVMGYLSAIPSRGHTPIQHTMSARLRRAA